MADRNLSFDYNDPAVPVDNSNVTTKPIMDTPSGRNLSFDYDKDVQLQNYTDDQKEALDTANNKFGFIEDAKYRWDFFGYQNLQRDLSFDVMYGRKTADEAKGILNSRSEEIQQKFGLSELSDTEKSPYNVKLFGKDFDIGQGITQSLNQFSIAKEMGNPRSLFVVPLSFGIHWVQNQKITAAGAAIGAAITAPIGGEGAAPGAAIAETGATIKTVADTLNDTRNVAVFFDTASREGSDFFYQAHVENGVDKQEAINYAIAIGIANGAMETWAQDMHAMALKKGAQMLTGGLEKKAAQEAKKLVLEGMKKDAFKEGLKGFIKNFGGNTSSEIVTELAQELTTISAEIETGQLNLNDPEQRKNTLDRLAQVGVSTAAGTLILGSLSGAVEFQNRRIEVTKTNLAIDKQSETNVSAKLIGSDGKVLYSDNGDVNGNNSNGVGNNGVEGQGQGTGNGNKQGNNAGDGIIDLPNVLGKIQDSTERHIVSHRVKQLDNSIKANDKEIAKAEKEYTKLKSENKSTVEVEKRLVDLHDNRDFAVVEKQSILSGDKKVADIISENIKQGPDKTLSMRAKQIDTEISQINQDIKDAEKTRSITKQGGKSLARISEKLAKLNEKLDALNNEKALIKSGGLQTSVRRYTSARRPGRSARVERHSASSRLTLSKASGWSSLLNSTDFIAASVGPLA